MDNRGLCGADCSVCGYSEKCRGCEATDCSPFGGRCVAAEHLKTEGRDCYEEFKGELIGEINDILDAECIPRISELKELVGRNVNMMYMLPNGFRVKFLSSRDIYLGCQIAIPDSDICYGVVAGTEFIIICTYRAGGKNPELVVYKRRIRPLWLRKAEKTDC